MPQSDRFKSQTPVLVYVSLSGDKIFVDVIKLRISRGDHLELLVGPKFSESILIWDRKEDTESYKEEAHGKTKAIIRMMHAQAKKYQELLTVTKN